MANDRTRSPLRRGTKKADPGKKMLQGFSEEMQPIYGDAIALDSKTSEVLGLSADRQPVVTSVAVSVDGSGANSLDDVLSGEVQDAFQWYGAGLSLEPLKPILLALEGVSDVVVAVLQAAKIILEAMLVLISALDNLLRAVIDALIEQITEILGFFTKTGIYWTFIPPQFPPEGASKERAQLLKNLKAFMRPVKSDETTGEEVIDLDRTNTAQEFGFLPADINIASEGGMPGFISTLQASMEDVNDPRRPQFDNNDWVAGFVGVFGGRDITLFLDWWATVKKLFGKQFKEEENKFLPPAPAGVRYEILGAKAVSERGARPYVSVSWDAPRINIKSPWQPVEDFLYRVKDKVSMTKDEFSNHTYYNDFETGTFTGALVGGGQVYRATTLRNYVDTSITESELGQTFRYRVARAYQYVNPKTGEIGAKLTYVFSRIIDVKIPIKAVPLATGIPPNWTSGTIATLIPALDRWVSFLVAKLRAILGVLPDITGYIKQLVQQIIAEVNKWLSLAQEIRSLVYQFTDLMDMQFGAHALTFIGKGGNNYVIDLLNQSVALAKTEEAASAASATEMQIVSADSEGNLKFDIEDVPIEKFDIASNFEKVSFKDFVSVNPVPTYGPNDITGGFVLLGGDGSYTGAQQAAQLFEMFFPGPQEETEVATTTAVQSGLTAVASANAAKAQAVIGEDPPERTVPDPTAQSEYPTDSVVGFTEDFTPVMKQNTPETPPATDREAAERAAARIAREQIAREQGDGYRELTADDIDEEC